MIRSLAPVLGCGVMMLVCMAVMARGSARDRHNNPASPTAPAPASADEVAALRDEVARLRALDDERREGSPP